MIQRVYLIAFICLSIAVNGSKSNDITNDAIKSTSFDSLISSQCRARCLSLYPWRILNNQNNNQNSNERKHRSMWHFAAASLTGRKLVQRVRI